MNASVPYKNIPFQSRSCDIPGMTDSHIRIGYILLCSAHALVQLDELDRPNISLHWKA